MKAICRIVECDGLYNHDREKEKKHIKIEKRNLKVTLTVYDKLVCA